MVAPVFKTPTTTHTLKLNRQELNSIKGAQTGQVKMDLEGNLFSIEKASGGYRAACKTVSAAGKFISEALQDKKVLYGIAAVVTAAMIASTGGLAVPAIAILVLALQVGGGLAIASGGINAAKTAKIPSLLDMGKRLELKHIEWDRNSLRHIDKNILVQMTAEHLIQTATAIQNAIKDPKAESDAEGTNNSTPIDQPLNNYITDINDVSKADLIKSILDLATNNKENKTANSSNKDNPPNAVQHE